MGKKTAQSFANKKREHPSDFDRLSALSDDLRELGYSMTRDQVVRIGERSLKPDGMIIVQKYPIPIEHDGGVHGSGDEVSESGRTKQRNDLYIKGGNLPLIVNQEWLQVNKIPQRTYLKCTLFLMEQWLRAKSRLR